METKIKNQSLKIGEIILSPDDQKYEIMERISSNKKTEPSTSYQHLETFIVKRLSNKVYHILKRYKLHIPDKSSSSKNQPSSPSKDKHDKNLVKQLKSKLLFHPNLLSVEEIFFDKRQTSQKTSKFLIFIEEYCEEGDLAYFVKQQSKKCLREGKKELFQEKLIGKWLLQILLALEHLHFNKLTHQALKPNNIYLTPLGNLKLNQSYLLNSLNELKEVRKSKENSTPLMDVYEPMFNEKKFKINEKKDVFDFGILISYLCNSRMINDLKKEVKAKNFVHLPLPYSENLDQIYVNCLNTKRTTPEVKDILKTPYFLDLMREFIIDKKLHLSLFDKIPIKKYAIHKKSIIVKPVRTNKKYQDKHDKQTADGMLPRIQKNPKHSDSRNSLRKNQKQESKGQNQLDLKKVMRVSLEKLKNKLGNKLQSHLKQKLSREKKVKNLSTEKKDQEKQIQRRSQKEKLRLLLPLPPHKDLNKNNLLPPPTLTKCKRISPKSPSGTHVQGQASKSNRQEEKSVERKETENISKSQSKSSKKIASHSNENKLTPQITFGKKIVSNFATECQGSNNQNFKQQAKKQQFGALQDSREIELEKISQNLAKIFSDLKIREDDDEQLSFELGEKEEEELRLTFKLEKESTQISDHLVKTYKSKFEQIISELQEKYQPNLQTIIQKTHEWDSNQFVVNRELLNRLVSEDKQVMLARGNSNT